MKLGGMSPKAEVLDQDKVIVIHGFLSGEECAALIQRSESLRYDIPLLRCTSVDELPVQFRRA